MEMSVREQAAQWVTDLADATPGARARFAEWLKESPRHVEEFLFFDAMWQEFEGVDGGRQMDVDRLVEEIKAAAGSQKERVVPIRNSASASSSDSAVAREPLRKERAKRIGWSRAAAAVLAIGLASGLYWGMPLLPGTRTYETALGEQRAVKLDDGSFVYLNTGTRIRVDFSPAARDLQLIAGEALFKVARDPARPFRVDAGDAVIQAVGTEFNVYRRAQGMTVSVIEGAVRVSADSRGDARAAAAEEAGVGEQVNVIAGDQIRLVKQAAMDVEKAVAWRERRLVFHSEPLEDVAAQFNRYNTLKIRVEGETVRSRKLIGTFGADDPESLAQFLAQEPDLTVERQAQDLIIRAR